MENKKRIWGQGLDNVLDCEKLIKETCWFLLAMAGLMFLFSLVLKQFFILLPDVLFMLICAFILKKHQSRTISVILLLYSILICIVTFGNKLHIEFFKEFGGGTNIFLALLFVYAAINVTRATFKLFKLKNYSISWKNFLIKSAIAIVLLFLFGAIAIILGIMTQNNIIAILLMYLAIFLSLYIAYSGMFPRGDRLKIKYIASVDV